MNLKKQFLKQKKNALINTLNTINNLAIFEIPNNSMFEKSKLFKLLNNNYKYISINVNSYKKLQNKSYKSLLYQNIYLVYNKLFFNKKDINFFLNQKDAKLRSIKINNKIYHEKKLKLLLTLKKKKN